MHTSTSRRHLLGLGMLLAGGVAGCASEPAARRQPAAFDLQGHRGARGLAPENTLAAFDTALALGVSTLELDIGLSADGMPMVVHDPYLPPDMARDAQGQWLDAPTPRIHSLKMRELRRYDLGRARPDSATARNFPDQKPHDGERMPLLLELFVRVRDLDADQVRFNIETKLNPTRPQDTATPERFVRAILAAARLTGMQERISIQSFDWRSLQLVQQQAPKVPTVYLTVRSKTADNAADPAWTGGLRLAEHASVPDMVKAAGGHTWSPNHASLDEAALQRAQKIGLQVIPWTVNEPADLRRLIDWGVDGLITDYPDRGREALQAAGRALPAPVRLPRPVPSGMSA